ncbi:MAG: hypothetical protein WB974_20060, partial [Acidobacteriaceae bacterium]
PGGQLSCSPSGKESLRSRQARGQGSENRSAAASQGCQGSRKAGGADTAESRSQSRNSRQACTSGRKGAGKTASATRKIRTASRQGRACAGESGSEACGEEACP